MAVRDYHTYQRREQKILKCKGEHNMDGNKKLAKACTPRSEINNLIVRSSRML